MIYNPALKINQSIATSKAASLAVAHYGGDPQFCRAVARYSVTLLRSGNSPAMAISRAAHLAKKVSLNQRDRT